MACGTCGLDNSISVDPSGLGTVCSDDAWSQCALTMLRAWIGDLAAVDFTDDRLLDVLKVAAYFVYVELAGCEYISKPQVDVCTGCFDADPLLYPSFTSLTTLKAACMVDTGRARIKAVQEGLQAVCGPASLKIASSSAGFSALLNSGPCEAYKELKEELCFRAPIHCGLVCKQIMGTFVSQTLQVSNSCNSCSECGNCGHKY